MTRTPTQTFALCTGVALTLLGLAGFLYSSDFPSGHAVVETSNRGAVLGIFNVNGWHNLLHLLTGLLGLASARSLGRSRRYALTIGLLYALVALLGVVAGNDGSIVSLIPVNGGDDVLHTVIALLGLAAGLATSATPSPTLIGGEPRSGVRFD